MRFVGLALRSPEAVKKIDGLGVGVASVGGGWWWKPLVSPETVDSPISFDLLGFHSLEWG